MISSMFWTCLTPSLFRYVGMFVTTAGAKVELIDGEDEEALIEQDTSGDT